MADTAASEPHATSAFADERLNIERRRSQDDPAPCGHERREAQEDDREAPDDAAQDDREAHDGQAQDGEAEHRETHHREARRPEDHGAPQERWALHCQAHDPQEAPLTQGWF